MDDQFSKEELEEAERLKDFYIHLVEENNQSLPYYLASNVVLDWFGKTIRDTKLVSSFLKEKIGKINHHIKSTVPAENVAFKDCHHVKIPKEDFVSVVQSSSPSPETTSYASTPPKTQIKASTSTIEIGQGDGIHNLLMSPRKKMRMVKGHEDIESVEEAIVDLDKTPKLKYLTATGTVEFHRPSIKKLQTETKWHRPVKLHLGYTSNNFKDCTIYLIIYEGNVKCRRNLYKEFCKEVEEEEVDE